MRAASCCMATGLLLLRFSSPLKTAFIPRSPSEGGTPPVDDFIVSSEFSDVAGTIDGSGLVFIADNRLIGLLSQDGTQGESVEAGQNFGHLFDFAPTTTFRDGGNRRSGSLPSRIGP